MFNQNNVGKFSFYKKRFTKVLFGKYVIPQMYHFTKSHLTNNHLVNNTLLQYVKIQSINFIFFMSPSNMFSKFIHSPNFEGIILHGCNFHLGQIILR